MNHRLTHLKRHTQCGPLAGTWLMLLPMALLRPTAARAMTRRRWLGRHHCLACAANPSALISLATIPELSFWL